MRALLLVLFVALAGCASKQSTAKPVEPADPHPIGVGDRAPDVTPGKVTLVVFGATWSEPSKKCHGRIDQIWRARQGKGLAIKGILVDDEPNAPEVWRKSLGFTFPLEWDRDRRLLERYGLHTETAVFVVDRAGIVRHVHIAYHDGEDLKIESETDALLEPTKPASPSPAR